MKHLGSISQTYLKRDLEVIPMLFNQAKGIAQYPTTMKELCTIAADIPTPFFCISDESALDYIRRRLLHNQKRKFCTCYKQKLYDALWVEFKDVIKMQPQLSVQSAVFMALSRPAPCVGLTPWILQLKISRYQRKGKDTE